MDYCRYSASPVGRHVLALHGIGERRGSRTTLCVPRFKVINHIQDCADDYRQLDRVYIPQDMLAARDGSIVDLATPGPPGLRQTLQAMLDSLSRCCLRRAGCRKYWPDARLKMETSVICVLAERLVKLLRARDPFVR